MFGTRLTLAHSRSVLWASLLLACGSTHGAGDGGTSSDASRIRDGGSATVDAAPRDAAAPSDAGVPSDAGPRGRCDAEDAREELCPDLLCDGPPSWHWDGETCNAIDCGACLGTECDLGVSSQSECETAHALCEAPLCNTTGGVWLWWRQLCGHHVCGQEPPATCESGAPACDCGSGRNFVTGVGCMVDSSCPEVDPPAPDVLCTSTGGTWESVCCNSECGIGCGDDCTALACTCGPTEVFNPERGCEVGARCMERLNGESCDGMARCERGTICCDRCGGPGCAGEPTCRFPECATSAMLDMCGNNPIAP